MNRLIAMLLLLAFALALPTSGRLTAQQEPVASVQELARTKFKELHDRMQKLQVLLQSTDAKDSKLLGLGNRYIQESKLHEQMEQIRKLLGDEKWGEANDQMQDVRKKLSKLHELLSNRNLELQQLLEEIARLSAYRDRVDALAKEQGQEKDDSAKVEELQRQLAEIADAKAKAQALLAEQKDVRSQTNQLGLGSVPEATQPLAKKEADLKERTDELAKKLDEIDKRAAELSKPAKSEAGKPADPKEAKPGQSAGKAGSAAQSMGQAQKNLADKLPEPSLKDQDQAIEKLGQTIEELDRMAEEASRELLKLPFENMTKAQEKTKTDTDTLSKDMEQGEKTDETGEKKPTPGKNKVQQAVPKQKAAAGQLKELKPAKQKQQDAKEDLESARDELDEAIAQLRQQLQDEILRALEERFAAMLAKQKELSEITRVVNKQRETILTASGDLPASLVERCQGIASGEFDLGTEAADALKLLEEEGTTAVFPEIVTDLKDELYGVAKMCRGNDTGERVQTRQKEIEETLALLINSLRRTIEKREGG